MDNMSLEEAYEIAGGYKKVDEQTFLKSLEIVKKDDPTFATALEEAHLLELKKQLDDVLVGYHTAHLLAHILRFSPVFYRGDMKIIAYLCVFCNASCETARDMLQ